MFICNVSMRKIKSFKVIFCILISIFLIVLLVSIYHKTKKSNKVYITDSNKFNEVYELPGSNYTNMLKDTYEHLNNYVGKKIKFTGFVHRLYDFNDNQFVLAREMFTSPISNNQAEVVVVGFLCESNNASAFSEKTWVEVEGEITEGFYHSKVPVIKVTNMKQVECPEMPFVNPPDGGYVGLDNKKA